MRDKLADLWTMQTNTWYGVDFHKQCLLKEMMYWILATMESVMTVWERYSIIPQGSSWQVKVLALREHSMSVHYLEYILGGAFGALESCFLTPVPGSTTPMIVPGLKVIFHRSILLGKSVGFAMINRNLPACLPLNTRHCWWCVCWGCMYSCSLQR